MGVDWSSAYFHVALGSFLTTHSPAAAGSLEARRHGAGVAARPGSVGRAGAAL